MTKDLYIIGNGFDLHHNINSSYYDFYKWLKRTNEDLVSKIEEVYEIRENEIQWWSDFENKLATLDVVGFGAQIACDNEPDLSSDHCDSMWNQAAIEVERLMTKMFDELRGSFREWVSQLNPPSPEKMLDLNLQDSIFINFNYTLTLENLYGVSQKRVLHIHGCVDSEEDFILGHGKDYEEIERLNHIDIPKPPASLSEDEIYEYYQSQYGTQEHEKLALHASISGIVSQKKPVKDIIQKIEYSLSQLKA